MSNQASLPSDINKEILNLTKSLTSIAEGWALLVETVKARDAEIAELKAPAEEVTDA